MPDAPTCRWMHRLRFVLCRRAHRRSRRRRAGHYERRRRIQPRCRRQTGRKRVQHEHDLRVVRRSGVVRGLPRRMQLRRNLRIVRERHLRRLRRLRRRHRVRARRAGVVPGLCMSCVVQPVAHRRAGESAASLVSPRRRAGTALAEQSGMTRSKPLGSQPMIVPS